MTAVTAPRSACPSGPTVDSDEAVPAESSSTAATSCRASAWLRPAPRTLAGMPAPDTAALTSTSTHAVNCAHASHTSTASAWTSISLVTGWRSTSSEGSSRGSDQPTKATSANGTPATSAVSARNAPIQRRTSATVRRRRRGAPGAGRRAGR